MKLEPRCSAQIGSHFTWHYLVHGERDNSFFWLKEKRDSLGFQVFRHSLKKPVVGWSPTLTKSVLTAIQHQQKGSQCRLRLQLGGGLRAAC